MENIYVATIALGLVIALALSGIIVVTLRLSRLLGLWVIVPERFCFVYTLFGDVVAKIEEPGLHCLWTKMGLKAAIVNFMGECRPVDLRLDQEYLRRQMVNTAEGTPLDVSVWYEMVVSDPIAWCFKNAEPQKSLQSNVSNSTVRRLSNQPLAVMLTDRHPMSKAVREDVSPMSRQWGFQVGSVYIRKVNFRDNAMIAQIEQKVVNRLIQVTATINQEGRNQVAIIKSTADSLAAEEFAKAAAIRPDIIGGALKEIGEDPDVLTATFEVLEAQNLIKGGGAITLVPAGHNLLPSLLASTSN